MEESSSQHPHQTPDAGRLAWLGDVPNVDLPALDALVEGLVQVQKQVSALQALEASMLSAAVDVVAATMAVRGIHDDQQLPWRELSAEIAAALRVSDRTVQARMGDAAALVQSFPAVHAALRDGRIDRLRARTIVDIGSSVPAGNAREAYESAALARAESLTVGRLGPACRAIADRLHPESIDERHTRARQRRRVGVTDLDDGMSRLFADLPSTLAHAVFDRLTQMAKTVQRGADAASPTGAQAESDGETDTRAEAREETDAGAVDAVAADAGAAAAGTAARTADAPIDARVTGAGGGERRDARTLDQIRTDVFADMLLSGVPDGHGPADLFDRIVARVQILVPAARLDPAADGAGTHSDGDGDLRDPHVPESFRRVRVAVGNDTAPSATLAGAGPIDTGTARILAGAARGWDRVFTDARTGGVLCVDRHDPSAHLKRLLAARDEHCRFPGCRQPVRRCEIDHTIPYRHGGPTCRCNLEHLCKGHHILKHRSRWRVRQLGDGILEWTSPTGRVYADMPAPRVRFVDMTAKPPDPPPF
jgi:hypothetical protein